MGESFAFHWFFETTGISQFKFVTTRFQIAFREKIGVYCACYMRRFLSITTILALLSMIMSPLTAAACSGTGKAVSCHGGAAPHCDRMGHEHHHMAESPSSSQSISAADSDTKCPMDCCTPGHRQSSAAAYSSSTLPPLAVSDQNIHVLPVRFISAGFSSHTDRGPPRA